MNDAEYKKLCDAMGSLINAEAMISNFKSRAGQAKKVAGDEYKDHKKDQPSWKVLAASLDEVVKLIAPASKTILKMFEIASKKNCQEISLDDAKKNVKKLMPELQKMDGAAADVLSSMEKVLQEVNKGDSMAAPQLRAMQNYAPQFIKYFNDFKLDINKLK